MEFSTAKNLQVHQKFIAIGDCVAPIEELAELIVIGQRLLPLPEKTDPLRSNDPHLERRK